MFRFSMKHLLLATALIAICAAALSTGSWFWTRLLFTVALVVNLGAVLGAIYLSGRARAFWTGFAMFGWTCWIISNHPLLQVAQHQLFAKQIAASLKEYTPEANDGIVMLHKTHSIAIFSFERTIHTTFELVFSFVGGVLGYAIYSARGTPQKSDIAGERETAG